MPSINHFLILPRPKPIPGEPDYRKYYAQANITLSFDDGDSGSVVIDSKGRVIAQVVRKLSLKPEQFTRDPVARKAIEFNRVGSIAVASPIRAVFEQLNITIPPSLDVSGPTSKTARVMVPGFDGGVERDVQLHAVERLREGLRKTRRGKLILGKVGQHRQEVRRLFATVRAIGAAWHELGGAAFYHQAVRSALDPHHMIPNSINGITREHLLGVMLPLFVRHGSAALGRDIERYRDWAVGMVLAVATMDDVPEVLARKGSTA
jgi:hypothetical protein